MTGDQVFFLFFLQNILNFFLFYFLSQKYSVILNDLNTHFENTTQMFLDHLSDMYYYSYQSYQNDEEDECDSQCEESDCEEEDEYEEEEYEDEEDEEEEVSENNNANDNNDNNDNNANNSNNATGASGTNQRSSSPYWDSDYEDEKVDVRNEEVKDNESNLFQSG